MRFGLYPKGSRTVASDVSLWIITWFGVLAVLIYMFKGLLDQLPPLVDSWRRFMKSLRK